MTEEIKTFPAAETSSRRLYRSVVNRRFAGVCGGLAEYFNIDPFLVRVIWVISVFATNLATLIAYFVAWGIIPENPHAVNLPPPSSPKSSNHAQYIFGVVLIVFGLLFLADRMNWDYLVPWHWRLPYWFSWGAIFSVLIILFGLMLIFRSGDRTSKPSTLDFTGTVPPASPVEPAKLFTDTASGEKRLLRSLTDRRIGGVCGGLAKYLGIDPSLVRLGFVVFTVLTWVFIGIFTYIVMMIVVPEENPAAKSPVTPGSSL